MKFLSKLENIFTGIIPFISIRNWKIYSQVKGKKYRKCIWNVRHVFSENVHASDPSR